MSWKDKAQALCEQTAALTLAMHRPDVPWYAKAAAGLTVGYALSPVDLIPDFIPVLGYLDDLLLLPLLIMLSIRLIPPLVMEECRREARGLWQNGKPKKWYYAVPILLFWTAVIAWILWKLFS